LPGGEDVEASGNGAFPFTDVEPRHQRTDTAVPTADAVPHRP
jgi:hypothetical protein